MDELRFDADGLIPAVAQDRLSGEVRMLAWMSRESLARTLDSGLATFWSRSRGTLWQKGESSGHVLRVRHAHADCDGDALLLACDPEGPSCHTGRPSCFFRALDSQGHAGAPPPEALPATSALPALGALERTIAERALSTAARSYTRTLLDRGPGGVAAKVREEAAELAAALEGESAERVAAEAADLLYHLLVGLRARDVAFCSVLDALDRRSGQSGHAEKAARGAPAG
jgi:phosphoribosyl-ATP pyrophosphohydrolase/phosphoribosyl-AMP cyclohydrolase